MNVPISPTIDLRISRPHAEVILAGLKHIVVRYQSWQRFGYLIDCHENAQFPAEGFDSGEPDDSLIAKLFALLKSMSSMTKLRKRFSLDAFDLALCLFCIRVALTDVRHGHCHGVVQGDSSSIRQAAAKLVDRLEILRKRAKRTYVRRQSHVAFSEASDKLKRFLRWLRLHFLYCKCKRRKMRKGLWKILCEKRRQNLQRDLAIIRERLRHWEIPEPNDKELERILRNAERATERRKLKLSDLDRDERENQLSQFLWQRIFGSCRDLAWSRGWQP